MGLLLYPYFLVVFWYRDFFLGSIRITSELIVYAAELLSIPVFFKTFFKPLKNEYRDGLVVFSVLTGIIIKTLLLLICLPILAIFVAFLVVVNLAILLLPGIIVWFIVSGI